MAVSVNPIPIPSNDRLVKLRNLRRYPNPGTDPNEGKMEDRWQEYFTQAAADLAAASVRVVDPEELTDQAASISATDLSGGDLAAGVYEFVALATITQAATTSMSLTLTLDWRSRTQTKSESAVSTVNSTGTVIRVGGLIRIDDSSPVRYATTYVSVGATPMKYELIVVLRRVAA